VSVVVDISSIRDLLLRVKELGTKARLYEPSLAKASEHLQRLGAENDKERSVTLNSNFFFFQLSKLNFAARPVNMHTI